MASTWENQNLIYCRLVNRINLNGVHQHRTEGRGSMPWRVETQIELAIRDETKGNEQKMARTNQLKAKKVVEIARVPLPLDTCFSFFFVGYMHNRSTQRRKTKSSGDTRLHQRMTRHPKRRIIRNMITDRQGIGEKEEVLTRKPVFNSFQVERLSRLTKQPKEWKPAWLYFPSKLHVIVQIWPNHTLRFECRQIASIGSISEKDRQITRFVSDSHKHHVLTQIRTNVCVCVWEREHVMVFVWVHVGVISFATSVARFRIRPCVCVCVCVRWCWWCIYYMARLRFLAFHFLDVSDLRMCVLFGRFADFKLCTSSTVSPKE